MIKADANRQHSVPGSEWMRPRRQPCRAGVSCRRRCGIRGGNAGRAEVHLVADPASRWTGANGGLAFFAYCTNYLIDLKHAVIVDVEATTAIRQAEVTAQQRMIERTQDASACALAAGAHPTVRLRTFRVSVI